MRHQPPKLAQWILKLLFPDNGHHTPQGDFGEIFQQIAEEEGTAKARRWYWKEIFASIPGFIKNKVYWSVIMFKNYLIIALRHLIKNKVYSFINIFGLAVGLTAVILILLYIQFEISFDTYHEKAERIFRIALEDQKTARRSPVTPAPLAPAMKEDFPEIVSAVRFFFHGDAMLISYKEKHFLESGICFADPGTFDIFSFKLLKGDPKTALTDPDSIIPFFRGVYRSL